MRPTFHLVPLEVWEAADRGRPYEAASLAEEGFIHCTDGEAELAATFDRHYAADPRSFMALTLDLDALDVPWRFDDPGSPYPHIYGPIRWPAILGVQRVERLPDGPFEALSPA
jgi:uncharacterized protein (DUF952 family)